MSFPQTRHTLIQRISVDSREDDWRQFLSDYWRPLCRFAARWGRLNLDDAEDVAGVTIEVIIRNKLLSRWIADRRAKLRTLLCSIVRKVLSEKNRKDETRARRLRDHGGALDRLAREVTSDHPPEAPPEHVDAFYAAWAEELLQTCVESLLQDYHREGRGDYFRVLYGRICEQMTTPEIAKSLGITITSAENFYKHARKRLGAELESLVRQHVLRYEPPEEVETEFRHEWGALGDFLKAQGGLEEALRKSYEGFDTETIRRREVRSMTAILTNVRAFLDPPDDSTSATTSSVRGS